MILKEYQIKDLIKKKSFSPFILLYGPNEGLIRENVIKISNSFKDNEDTDEISISGKNIDDDPSFLDQEIRSFSMFSKRKIIHLEKVKDKHLESIKNLEIEDENILIILKEDNLNKRSKIRSFFDNHSSYIAIACYEDDVRSTMNLITQFQSQNNLKFSDDIKNYLTQNLSHDRLVSTNELEKINLLLNNQDNQLIKLKDVQEILNDGALNSLNQIVENVMYGKLNKTSKTLSKLFAEGIYSITIIRSLLNYLTRIHQTQIELKKIGNIEDAIKSLRPPIFWKDKETFKSHCLKWPHSTILISISKLLEAEYECKIKSSLTNEICENYILSIAKRGESYFN